MAMTPTFIQNALAYNAANPTQSQADAATMIANAIIQTIESATLTYTSGLVAPPSGGAVTGSLASVVIS